MTCPSSSEESPKLQQRPPRTIAASRKRRFMHQRPRSVPRRPRCIRWTSSGGARIGPVSPVQFSSPYSRLQFEHCSRLVVSPLASSTAVPPAGSAPDMGCCYSSRGGSAAALLLLLTCCCCCRSSLGAGYCCCFDASSTRRIAAATHKRRNTKIVFAPP